MNTQEILQLYAEHEGAEWMIGYKIWQFSKSKIACSYLLNSNQGTALSDVVAVHALLGSLLAWLADEHEYGVYKIRECSVTKMLGAIGKWTWCPPEDLSMHGSYDTIHHAALAAYTHIQEGK